MEQNINNVILCAEDLIEGIEEYMVQVIFAAAAAFNWEMDDGDKIIIRREEWDQKVDFFFDNIKDISPISKSQVKVIFQGVANRPIPEIAALSIKDDAIKTIDYFNRVGLPVAVFGEFISLETLRRISGFGGRISHGGLLLSRPISATTSEVERVWGPPSPWRAKAITTRNIAWSLERIAEDFKYPEKRATTLVISGNEEVIFYAQLGLFATVELARDNLDSVRHGHYDAMINCVALKNLGQFDPTVFGLPPF